MKSKKYVISFAIIVMGILISVGTLVYVVDPYFHYHKPDTEKFYYSLYNERYQNDGIVKHFEYDAIITGTSMTENFKSSEMDNLFSVNSIKVPFSGGAYKEINDNLKVAFQSNNNIKIVLRSMDMNYFFDDSEKITAIDVDLPKYLYDKKILNDVYYIFSKNVYKLCISRLMNRSKVGITSFDNYSNWSKNHKCGINSVLKKGSVSNDKPNEFNHLTTEDKKVIYDNIYNNVMQIANEHLDTKFYCFITPYSAVWWNQQISNGNIYRQIEAEKYIIELLLSCDNIYLFSFNNVTDITTDLNNYIDPSHYAEWINSWMLKAMANNEYRITYDNYNSYIENEENFYSLYNYEELMNQEDYNDDSYAAQLLEEWDKNRVGK